MLVVYGQLLQNVLSQVLRFACCCQSKPEAIEDKAHDRGFVPMSLRSLSRAEAASVVVAIRLDPLGIDL